MKTVMRVCLACCLCAGFTTASRAGLITFDDLPSSPATDSATGLFFANNNSALYQGVTWDSRVDVVGDAYRVDTATPGPLFGIPHSGHFFITNGGAANDGILLATDQILLGAWFGQNQYFGFGSGADQVTIARLESGAIRALLRGLAGSSSPANGSRSTGSVGVRGHQPFREPDRDHGLPDRST